MPSDGSQEAIRETSKSYARRINHRIQLRGCHSSSCMKVAMQSHAIARHFPNIDEAATSSTAVLQLDLVSSACLDGQHVAFFFSGKTCNHCQTSQATQRTGRNGRQGFLSKVISTVPDWATERGGGPAVSARLAKHFLDLTRLRTGFSERLLQACKAKRDGCFHSPRAAGGHVPPGRLRAWPGLSLRLGPSAPPEATYL